MAKKEKIVPVTFTNGDVILTLSDTFVYEIEYYKIGNRTFNLDHTKLNVLEDEFLGFKIRSSYEQDVSDPRYKLMELKILTGAPLNFLEENKFKKIEDE